MFLVYWPVLALAVALILLAALLVVRLAGSLCPNARHSPLPERPLQTYLPEQVKKNYRVSVRKFFRFSSRNVACLGRPRGF